MNLELLSGIHMWIFMYVYLCDRAFRAAFTRPFYRHEIVKKKYIPAKASDAVKFVGRGSFAASHLLLASWLLVDRLSCDDVISHVNVYEHSSVDHCRGPEGDATRLCVFDVSACMHTRENIPSSSRYSGPPPPKSPSFLRPI